MVVAELGPRHTSTHGAVAAHLPIAVLDSGASPVGQAMKDVDEIFSNWA
jgi:hypothetical protein